MKSNVKKELEKQREDIIFTLPSFINQLLLLLNSGTMLDDAFMKIAKAYGMISDDKQNYFTREVYKIAEASLKNGENVIAGFYRFARFSNVKELTRVANILLENQNKGVDLWDKVAKEGEGLWDERKRLATEKIHLAETKMALPLGILLISLIIIAAAPAMMTLG